MTSPDDLLRAIIADPANDDLRMVYADLLDDRGEGERSSFIRVQCEIARLSDCPKIEGHIVEYSPPVNPRLRMAAAFVALVNRVDVALNGPYIIRHQQRDDTWWESEPVNIWKVEEWDANRVKATFGEDGKITGLRRLARELLIEHGPRWYEEFGNSIMGGTTYCASWSVEGPQPDGWMVFGGEWCVQREPFSRGFISRFTCTYDDWARHADAITARCPIERVTLTTWPQSYGTLLNSFYELIGVDNSAEVTHEEALARSMDWQDLAAELVKRTWPRITFTLPAEVAV